MNMITAIYDVLYEAYGPQHWWPGDSPWEICTGAVLTQNTNWNNVEKAIFNLKRQRMLSPEKILHSPKDKLEQAIRPCGYYRLKTERLKAVTAWWQENVKDDSLPEDETLEYWRDSLLSVKGVGPETADSILLYSFGLPTFVIDAYTKRIMHRHFGYPEDMGYHELQKLFVKKLPDSPAVYNEFHALIVRHAKEHCLKRSCSPQCPLRKISSPVM